MSAPRHARRMTAIGGIDPGEQDMGLPGRRATAGAGRLRAIAAAGEVLAAFANGTLDVPVAHHEVAAQAPAFEPTQDEPEQTEQPGPAGQREQEQEQEQPTALPQQIVFPPRRTTRTITGTLLLPAVAATGVAAWKASQGPTTVGVVVTVGLALGTLLLAVARARAVVATLSVTGTRLEILRAGTRMVFDLADPDTAVEIVGTPGRRGWKVIFPRRTLSPAVIDASMVDPRAFTPVVEFHRAQATAARNGT